jgi:hypothetical protein
MGKLILMLQLDAVDDFWKDDVQDMVNKSHAFQELVTDIFQLKGEIAAMEEAKSTTKH